MRFYQLNYILRATPINPTVYEGPLTRATTHEWFPTERAAVVRRLELFNKGVLIGKKRESEIWPVDVPTDKAGLLAFLQKECV